MSEENPYAPPESDVTVADSIELAGRGIRLGGSLIDSLIAMLILFPVMFVSGYWDKSVAGEQTAVDTLWFVLFGIAAFFGTHGYLLAKYGQTIGKRMLKIRIVSIDDGQILPLGKVFGYRYLPLLASSQIPLLGPLFGILDPLFIFRGDRRCLHDLIAGTKVVTVGAPQEDSAQKT